MTALLPALAALAAVAAAGAALGPSPTGSPRRPGPWGARLSGPRPGTVHRPGRAAAPSRLVAMAREAGLRDTWVQRWWGVLGATAATVTAVGLLAGPPVALALVVALLVAPRLAAAPISRRRRRRRDEQLAPWLERVAAGLRAGLSLPVALSTAAPTAPWPLREDLVELDRDVRSAGLAVGLGRWAARPGASPAVALTTSALDLGAAAGGEVARAVDRVAATLRDRVQAEAEVRALSTQARASAAVLGLAPLGFCALLATVEPAVPRILLATPVGWACLVVGVGLEVAGAAWMGRIVGGAR